MKATFRSLLLAAVGAVALSACGEAKPAVELGPAAAVRGREQTPKDVQLRIDQGVAAYLKSDNATALSLLRPLAGQGYADAQFYLGLMYFLGAGVPQNSAEASKWYRLAAEQGNAKAQWSLGSMYENGVGLPENDAEAVRWLRIPL